MNTSAVTITSSTHSSIKSNTADASAHVFSQPGSAAPIELPPRHQLALDFLAALRKLLRAGAHVAASEDHFLGFGVAHHNAVRAHGQADAAIAGNFRRSVDVWRR